MRRIIQSKNKKEIVDNLRQVYEWKSALVLDEIAKKLNRQELDALQVLFNDVWRKGWAAHDKWLDKQEEIARG
ncbi:hypothetical protein HFE03_07430 [Paenibacillus sp. EKM102P]|uniref:hypothetical protein n=1 Tax=unclassified Paenibacillus TaxID=185978 RepID=UPI00142E86FE|nr:MULTISPECIES: hypothetical protein [unclassified Paenibacillus]KAF6620477.1 hypothetical protein HFE00_05335 [Paenibacillus sp. EKM101P]KAF6623469.1 hypothetical protein HFE03_07430 [Paenibacillus sp. EKM102P]KAF6633968.1 hypothetical protein HFE01_07075 [Paenibacillus sp. EKM10P]KAF6649495.1 hypothetical protein HFE02_02040 [Paenibacillus sp. EKM11P]